jgi:hypothetical protein
MSSKRKRDLVAIHKKVDQARAEMLAAIERYVTAQQQLALLLQEG